MRIIYYTAAYITWFFTTFLFSTGLCGVLLLGVHDFRLYVCLAILGLVPLLIRMFMWFISLAYRSE